MRASEVVPGVPQGARSAERTAAAFCRELERLRDSSLPALDLIADDSRRASYLTAVLLRLMCLYFLQGENRRDRDTGALGGRPEDARRRGPDRFYGDVFLPACFAPGGSPLAGLFALHPAELDAGLDPAAAAGASGSAAPLIPDAVFERCFAEFDRWRWSLRTDPDGDPRVLTPDVVCRFVERSHDRKRSGAYYTGADVAGYICRSTVIPRLFDMLPRAEGPAAQALDDGVTRNLDLSKLALDWLENADLEAVRRFYTRCLLPITILDPACGSGAFLVAALRVLVPLYAACLRRAPDLACSSARLPSEGGARQEIYAYLACKGVLLNNLFGVDLSGDGVDCCRIRLLLELLARGNTPGEAHAVDRALRFRILRGNAVAGFQWRRAFPAVLGSGGFDVAVGNPPYLDARGVPYRAPALATAACENVYAWVAERALRLLKPSGRCGLVLPISAVSVPGYRPLFEQVRRRDCWISTYSNRPAKLFEGVEQRLAIIIAGRSAGAAAPAGRLWVSPYQHWYEEERAHLFARLVYFPGCVWSPTGMPIKSGTAVAASIFSRIASHQGRLEELIAPGSSAVWLHDAPTYWVRALPFDPHPRPASASSAQRSGHYSRIPVRGQDEARWLAAVLSSTTFYFFFKMISNCRDLGREHWAGFPMDPLPSGLRACLVAAGGELENRLLETAAMRSRAYPRGRISYYEHYPARAKEVIDGVDRLLARHYGFSGEESDYILGYERRYRMGRGYDKV